MIRGIIFDLDNTLMDFMRMKRAAVDAAVDAMIDAGMTLPRQQMIDKIFALYFQEGIEDQQVFDKVLLAEFGKVDPRILAAGIVGYRRAKEGNMALYPHVHQALTTLTRMDIGMVIVSDAPRLPVWTRIISLGLGHYFDHVITLDDTGEKKPSPRPFRLALDRLGARPDEALMIGDWAERDVVGAKAVGIKTVFARYGDEFNTGESGADYEITDILQLVEIVRKENHPVPRVESPPSAGRAARHVV